MTDETRYTDVEIATMSADMNASTVRKQRDEIRRLQRLVQKQDIEIARLRGENAELVRQSGLMEQLRAARAKS